jgi:hypothetical protein
MPKWQDPRADGSRLDRCHAPRPGRLLVHTAAMTQANSSSRNSGNTSSRSTRRSSTFTPSCASPLISTPMRRSSTFSRYQVASSFRRYRLLARCSVPPLPVSLQIDPFRPVRPSALRHSHLYCDRRCAGYARRPRRNRTAICADSRRSAGPIKNLFERSDLRTGQPHGRSCDPWGSMPWLLAHCRNKL